MDPIVLASSSPRRQDILKLLNIPFVVNPADIEEIVPDFIIPQAAPEYLACKKMESIVHKIAMHQDDIGWVLGADTAILYEGKLFGKPKDRDEAREMITKFQGHTHQVITGVALYNGIVNDISTRTSVNNITFAPMDQKEIDWYISTGEWHGVAGGYRIQGVAACFIEKIEGNESSIMGLPIFELYDMFKEQGYSLID